MIVLTIRRIPLDRGGYAPDGHYFGRSPNNYVFEGLGEGPSGDGVRMIARGSSAKEARAAMARWLGVTSAETVAPRRRSATREALARAKAADAYAAARVAYAKSIERILETPDGQCDTEEYWSRAWNDYEDAIAALRVSADAYEEAGNMRQAKRQLRKIGPLQCNADAYAQWALKARERGGVFDPAEEAQRRAEARRARPRRT